MKKKGETFQVSSIERFNNAVWIWSPGKTTKPAHFAWFRQNLELPAVPGETNLFCCADSKYRLWVNGRYVGVGPARGDSKHPYYDSYEIGEFLRKGINVIAFLVEHYTTGSLTFSAVQGGLICQAWCGSRALLKTDKNWQCRNASAYHVIKHERNWQHLEVFDARLEPENWLRDWSKSGWFPAKELKKCRLAAPGELRARPIPQLTNTWLSAEKILSFGISQNKKTPDFSREDRLASALMRMERKPSSVGLFQPEIRTGQQFPEGGCVISPPGASQSIFLELDFGREIMGSPFFRIEGPAGMMVDIGYSEVLEDNKINPYRQNIFFAERLITRQGTTEHRVHQPRGFRFMLLRLSNFREKARLRTVSVFEEIYPISKTGFFHCSNPVLERIYDLCLRTMNLCMEDAFTDCPWRERQQWLGDLWVGSLTALYGFAAFDITRKAIKEFALSNNEEGWLPSVYPGGLNINIPPFGMKFPAIIWNYYLYTGEKEILQMAYPALKKMLGYFSRNTDSLGFFLTRSQFEEKDPKTKVWNFIDWTKLDENSNDGALQGFYLEALETSAVVARELSRTADAWEFTQRAVQLRRAIARHFWSKREGGFLKYRRDGSTRPPGVMPDLLGQHENFLFSLLRIGTKKMQASALEAISGASGKYLPNLGGIQGYFSDQQNVMVGNVFDEKVILIGSPFWSYVALKSLFEAGKDRVALEYIRNCWGFMLDHGATSCWEMWDRNTSVCHGFSTGPASLLIQYALGVRPIKPGFAVFEIAPGLAGLEWVDGSVPIKQGTIRVSWRREGRRTLKTSLDIPARTECRFTVPPEFIGKGYSLDGDERQDAGPVLRLKKGSHTLFFGGSHK